jgi:magnesium chelatase subunit D
VVSHEPFQGRYTQATRPRGRLCDVAWDATLRAVAHRQRARRETGCPALAIHLQLDELLVKQRVRRPGQLLLFVADASGSMGGSLTELARRIGAAALRDAYLKRAQVAVVAFRDRSAALLCGPTRKIGRVHGALEGLPLGGTTPLASGLQLACETVQRQRRRDSSRRCTLVLITDGRANVGSVPGYERVLREVEAAAKRLAALPDVPLLLLDTTEPGKNDQAARRLARWLQADRLPLGTVVGEEGDLAAALGVALGRWNLSPGSFPASWQSPSEPGPGGR